jgi:hypothetical protein
MPGAFRDGVMHVPLDGRLELGLTRASDGMPATSWNISSRRTPAHGRVLALLSVMLACACEVGPGARYAASPDPRRMDPNDAAPTSGGEQRELPRADVDEERIGRWFPQLRGVRRVRTCAPEAADWAILTYEPEVVGEHRVRTRELHCRARMIDERCSVVSDVRYYVDDPREYFAVDAGLSLERALRVAKLTQGFASEARLAAIAAEKGGVYLVTLSQCGAEKQLATRIKGAGAKEQLEVLETRYSIAL